VGGGPTPAKKLPTLDEGPVFVKSRCNGAGDCIPDDRQLDTFEGGFRGGLAYVSLDPRRTVEIDLTSTGEVLYLVRYGDLASNPFGIYL
jgi:hypothetical protein